MADLNTDYWAAYDAKIKKELNKPVQQQSPTVRGAAPVVPTKPVLTPSGQARQNDMATGKDLLKEYFGPGNVQMNKVITAREQAAYGNDPRAQLLRDEAIANQNQAMQGAMRGLSGQLATSGVRGGAAGGLGLQVAAQAAQQRGSLERQLSADELARRDQALSALESTLTGERAGELGGMFGYAGLGAADRANEAQTGLGQDYLDYLMGKGKYAAPVKTGGTPATSTVQVLPQQGGMTTGINSVNQVGKPTAGGGTYGKAKHF